MRGVRAAFVGGVVVTLLAFLLVYSFSQSLAHGVLVLMAILLMVVLGIVVEGVH